VRPDSEAVIERFFSPPNTLAASDDAAVAWVTLAREGADAFVLPQRDPEGTWTWYVIGLSEASARGLREEVEGFIGSTYGQLEPEAGLDPKDPREAVLAEVAEARVSRLRVSEENAAAVKRQFQTLQLVSSRRPPSLGLTQRSTSQVLRDLDSAMQAGQLRQARELIDELRSGGRLSGVNLECLEIWWLSAQERWSEIIVRPGLDDLVTLRLPRHPTAALIDAAYHVHIESHEQRLTPGALADLFAERVLPRFGRLFRDPKWSSTGTGRKAWLLFAATATPPSQAIRDVVLESAALDPEREILLALATATDQARADVGVVEVSAAVASMLESGDYPGAWDTATSREDADPVWRARVLLHCAYETVNPEWAAVALKALEEARADRSDQLNGRTVAEQEQELRRLVTPAEVPIATWRDWLEVLVVSDAPRELVSLARDRSQEWSADSLLAEEGSEDIMLDALTSRPERADALREVRPFLAPAVFAAAESRPDFAPSASRFLRLLADAIAGDERLGRGDLEDLASIAEFVITSGVNPAEYRKLVNETLERSWQRVASVNALGWLIDILELLRDSPCASDEARVAFSSAVLVTLARFRGQIPPEHWERLDEVFESLGRQDEIAALRPTAEESAAALAEWQVLAGRTIFIYTLVEPAGERARRHLLEVAPDLQVDVWSARVSDDRMLEAVRRADLVVIATRAAKHAATLAVERAVLDQVPVAYPTGKGWSSIVSSVRDALPILGTST
jgi:hypothetical protein